MGCIPAQITVFGSIEQKSCVEDQNAIALVHNKWLKAAIPKWQASLPGSQLLYLDSYSLVYDIFNNPSKYGTDFNTLPQYLTVNDIGSNSAPSHNGHI